MQTCVAPFKPVGTECIALLEDKTPVRGWDQMTDRCMTIGGLPGPLDPQNFIFLPKPTMSRCLTNATSWIATDSFTLFRTPGPGQIVPYCNSPTEGCSVNVSGHSTRTRRCLKIRPKGDAFFGGCWYPERCVVCSQMLTEQDSNYDESYLLHLGGLMRFDKNGRLTFPITMSMIEQYLPGYINSSLRFGSSVEAEPIQATFLSTVTEDEFQVSITKKDEVLEFGNVPGKVVEGASGVIRDTFPILLRDLMSGRLFSKADERSRKPSDNLILAAVLPNNSLQFRLNVFTDTNGDIGYEVENPPAADAVEDFMELYLESLEDELIPSFRYVALPPEGDTDTWYLIGQERELSETPALGWFGYDLTLREWVNAPKIEKFLDNCFGMLGLGQGYCGCDAFDVRLLDISLDINEATCQSTALTPFTVQRCNAAGFMLGPGQFTLARSQLRSNGWVMSPSSCETGSDEVYTAINIPAGTIVTESTFTSAHEQGHDGFVTATYEIKEALLDDGEDVTEEALLDDGEDVTEEALLGDGEDVMEEALLDDGEDVTEKALLDAGEDVTEEALLDDGEDVTEEALLDDGEDVTEEALLDDGEDVTEEALLDDGEDVTEEYESLLGDGESTVEGLSEDEKRFIGGSLLPKAEPESGVWSPGQIVLTTVVPTTVLGAAAAVFFQTNASSLLFNLVT